MKLLCALFDHCVPRSMYLHRVVSYQGTDGLGIHHYRVEQPCGRCGELFTVAMVTINLPGRPPELK